MRRFFLSSLVAAACLVSVSALAASNRVTAQFDSVSPAATGISGQVTLGALPSGQTMVHTQLRGLQPGADYVVNLYPQGSACGSGLITTEVWQFKANPNGIANFNQKVSVDISEIGSVSLQRPNEITVLSCADVTP
jgi:cytochrome c556